MFIHPNEILDFLKKENRPILESELLRKFGVKSEEEIDLVPDDEAEKIVQIYIWAKEFNQHGQRNEPYYFHPDLLEEFWLNEILYMLRVKNDQIDIKEIIDDLEKQFVNYYNLSDPLGKSFQIKSDAGLGEEKNKKLIEFIDKHSDIFYRRIGEGEYASKTWFIGLNDWKDKVLENDRKIIRNAVIKILRDMKGQSLSPKELTYSVNRIKLDTLLPKPFNEEIIKQILSQNSGRIVYDIAKDKMTLSDDLEYLKNYFKENQQNYNDFKYPQHTSGFLAWTYNGNNFPLKEASEYVKTRPIIFIDEILHRFTQNVSFNEEFREYLHAVLDTSDDEEIEIWLSENVTLSYYEESLPEIKKMYPKIIEKFSPVFNLNKNPGNLFQYTLQLKLKEYLKKYTVKIKPF